MGERFVLGPNEGRPPKRPRREVTIVVAIFLVVAAVLALSRMGDHSSSSGSPEAGVLDRPSIVVIVTDDQRWDTLQYMPIVQEDLVEHGVTFRNGFVVNPACCPSRASILTGRYSHSTGVYTNRGSEGGFLSFNDGSTVATWLSTDYTTALLGKYLNKYQVAGANGEIPLGWDHWVAFVKPQYEDFELNIDGDVVRYPASRSNYSTDVLADEAVEFIGETRGPLFLYFTPKAPHYPATPEAQDRSAYTDLAPWRPPSFDEADVSDKPMWVRRVAPLDPPSQAAIERFRIGQLRTLLPVDRAVGRIVDALQETGRLDNTIIVFTSDNGYMWGEHRLVNKAKAYEESIRVPYVVRYDPLTSTPSTSDDMVLNIDIAPTAAALAGVPAPGAEGRSFLPLLRDPSAPWRDAFLIEHFAPGGPQGHPPTFCAVRTDRWKYVDYYWGEDELYDLSNDRFEMDNRINDPAVSAILNDLQQRERALCDPPPPRKLDYYARG